MAKTNSEDTIILSALSPSVTDVNIVHEALKQFFEKKKEIDYNDRFNGILFTKKNPQYLEDFTLNQDYLLEAIKNLTPHIGEADIAGGIFIALTFLAEVFKKISGKVFRIILLTDSKSIPIPEDHLFFIEDLLDKMKDMPVIMDVVRINTDDPKNDLMLMRLARRTGGDIYEIKELRKERSITAEEIVSIKDRVSKTTTRVRKMFGDLHDKIEEPKKPQDLFEVLDILAQKKEIKHEILNIAENNLFFYESLAEKPIEIERSKAKEKCTICFTSVNQDMLKCPACGAYTHKICTAIWSKSSNIGIPYLFRCHNCYALIKLDKEFVGLINSIKTPTIEMSNLEDVVLEEYLESLEKKEGPKLITSQESLPLLSQEENQNNRERKKDHGESFKLKHDKDLEIVWCANCGKITSNEFTRCPQCGAPIVVEEPMGDDLEEIEIEKKVKNRIEINRLNFQSQSDLKAENYEEVIKKAKRIIDIAKETDESAILQEQELVIAKAQEKIDEKNKVSGIKKKFSFIKEKFDGLVKQEKLPEAHKIVEEFKQSNKTLIDGSNVPELTVFLKDSERLWKEYLDGRKKEAEEVKKLEVKKRVEKAERIERKIEIKKEGGNLEQDLSKKKAEYEQLMKQIDNINEILKSSSKLTSEFAFDGAISLLEKGISGITTKELSDYKIKLVERKAEIKSVKKQYEDKIEILSNLEKSANENQEKKMLYLAISDYKKAIQVAKQINQNQKLTELEGSLKAVEEEIEEEQKKWKQSSEDLINKAKEFESVIKFDFIEEDVVPIIEEISATDAKGVLTSDPEAMVDVVRNFLKDVREKIESQITRKTVFIYESGKIEEIEEKLAVSQRKSNKTIPSGKVVDVFYYQAKSDVVNKSDEVATEVIIYDLIPYNYEISALEINASVPAEVPEKRFTKEGLELRWKLKALGSKETQAINYKFKKRVLRTLLFVFKEILHTVKTYYNIKLREKEEKFDLLLPFEIGNDVKLKWLVVEDLIPEEFVFVVIEPKNILDMETSRTKNYRLIGWVHGSVESGTHLYYYKLFETHKLEELKEKLGKLFKEALEALSNDELMEVVKKSKTISAVLNDNIE